MENFKGKKALIVGMARSGLAAASLLLELGAEVYIYDAKAADAFGGSIEPLVERGAVSLLGSRDPEIVDGMDMLVLSPGVPPRIPMIQRAYSLGIDVIAEMELGWLCSDADFVAISGTNGKTTTTYLTGEIFKNAGGSTFVLGNIGIPICEQALETGSESVVVAETAALQLETAKTFRPRAAALLNLTEDHMDRYGTMENYTAAKLKMFENQTAEDFAVLNYDNLPTRAVADSIRAKVLWFSRKEVVGDGSFLVDGRIVFKCGDKTDVICPAEDVRIPGGHNIENALAATALARSMGIAPEVIAETLRTFPGVEHRIETACTKNGVTFINDSKGTNTDAALKAIEAMTAPTVLILGGYDKHSEFGDLFRGFTEHIRSIVILGATREKLAEAAAEAGFGAVTAAEGFEEAVTAAYGLAKELAEAEGRANVLLSPACASWDMFPDFEVRGRVFKEIAHKL